MTVRRFHPRRGSRAIAARALVAAACVLPGWGRTVSPASAAPAAEGVAAASAVSQAPRGAWSALRIEYRSSVHTQGRLVQGRDGYAHPPGSELALDATVRGRLVRTELGEGEGGKRLVSLRMEQADVTWRERHPLAEPEDVRAALARLTVVELEPDGRIARLWIDPATEDVPAGFVRAVLALAQATAAPAGASAWEAEEEDPTGWCRVRYERTGLPDPDGSVPFRKKRLGYLAPQWPGEAGTAAPVIKLRGEFRGRLGQGGILRALEGDETQRHTLRGREVGFVRQRVVARADGAGFLEEGVAARMAAEAHDLMRTARPARLGVAASPDEREQAPEIRR